MAGLPGSGVNNPEGFADLTDPAEPHTINVPSITGNVSIPLSVLPFWRNDGGIRSYGGAKFVSIFEDGVTEGTSTDSVLAIVQQPIEQVGTFTLVDPDPQKIYAIRIRLRSTQSDPNYKDFVITFRVVSPLQVPIQFETYDDSALPQINFDQGLSQFNFTSVPPSTEIRLRSDGDGIILPVSMAPFSPEATAWLLGHLQRQRDGVFVVDFLKSGAVEATARVAYAYKWTGSDYTITKYRRKDYPDWGQYSGTDFGVAVAYISATGEPEFEVVGQFTYLTVGKYPGGLAYDNSTNTMYLMEDGGGTDSLYTVDVETGVMTLIGGSVIPGTLHCQALAFDPVGDRLIAGGFNSTPDGKIYEVNKSTGAASEIGTIGAYLVRGLAYDTERDVIYCCSSTAPYPLYEIDISAGFSATLVGNMGTSFVGLTFDTLRNRLIGTNDANPEKFWIVDRDDASQIELFDPSGIYGADLEGLCFREDLDVFYAGADTTADPNFYKLSMAAAELRFVKNLYGVGPRFESAVVAGPNGFLDVPPKMIQIGGTLDISSIVDFTDQRFLRRYGLDEQHVMLIGITDTQIVVRQIPLWDRAVSLYSVGGQQAIADLDAPPTYLFNSRVPLWPFLAFPNFLDFFDPAPTAPHTYPDLENIKLIDQNGVTQQTWADDVTLWNAMVSMRLPDQGTSIPVLDIRSWLSSTDSFYILEYDVIVDATGTNDYTIRSTFPLNVDGESLMWERPDLDVIEEMPSFEFNEWGVLSITTPNPWNGSGFTIIGDVSSQVFLVQGAGTTQDYDLAGTIMSREADYVLVQWSNGGNTIALHVPTTAVTQQLVGSNQVRAFFDGNTIMFPIGGLSEVQASGGVKNIILKGDVGSIPLYDVAEGVIYRLGLWGKGSRLFANPATPHLDIHFDGTTDRSAVRVANTFYDFREQGRSNGTLALANRGGPSTMGLKGLAYAFSMPRMKFLSETAEIEFENDGSNATYQTAQVMFINGSTGVRQQIIGTLVLGTAYQLGDAGRGLAVGDFIVVSAAHRNGYTTTVMYKLTEDYSAALKVTPEGYL